MNDKCVDIDQISILSTFNTYMLKHGCFDANENMSIIPFEEFTYIITCVSQYPELSDKLKIHFTNNWHRFTPTDLDELELMFKMKGHVYQLFDKENWYQLFYPFPTCKMMSNMSSEHWNYFLKQLEILIIKSYPNSNIPFATIFMTLKPPLLTAAKLKAIMDTAFR